MCLRAAWAGRGVQRGFMGGGNADVTAIRAWLGIDQLAECEWLVSGVVRAARVEQNERAGVNTIRHRLDDHRRRVIRGAVVVDTPVNAGGEII